MLETSDKEQIIGNDQLGLSQLEHACRTSCSSRHLQPVLHPRNREREREKVCTIPFQPHGLMQVLPGHALADPIEHIKQLLR